MGNTPGGIDESNGGDGGALVTERRPLFPTGKPGDLTSGGGSLNPVSVPSGSRRADSGSGSNGKDDKDTDGGSDRTSKDLRKGSDKPGGDKGGGVTGNDGASGRNRGSDRGSADSNTGQPWKPVADSKLKSEKEPAGKASTGKIAEDTVCDGLAAIFATIAVFSGHTHWERDPEECLPIAVPLARMINRLPPKQVAKLYELIDPAFLIGGLIEVAGPSVRVEIEEYQARNAPRIQGAPNRLTARDIGQSGVNGRSASNVSRSDQGIPTANAEFIGKTGGQGL